MKSLFALLTCFAFVAAPVRSLSWPVEPTQLVIVDTDIGDDIDDAFALGLVLNAPSVHVLGVTADWGDTNLRARMLDRFLAVTGHADVPVFAGPATSKAGMARFSQAAWAERAPAKTHGDAVEFILREAREHPGEVTVLSLGPATNLAAAFGRDPAGFRKLRRIVMMGGSVRRGYGEPPFLPAENKPSAEYNIKMDVAGAQAVFSAGVPLVVLPLDSTQIAIDETKRRLIFAHGSALTDVLAVLTEDWFANQTWPTPTAFDAVAALWLVDPQSCPVTPMRLEVDAAGFTRERPGKTNAEVCLEGDSDRFFRGAMPLWMR